jgi:hypothetical protein
MKKIPKIRKLKLDHVLYLLFFLGLVFIMLYKLGSLSGGVSASEIQASIQVVGWHGLYHNPLFMPLKLLRSIDFALFRSHGAYLTRLPNVILGALTIAAFGRIAYLWHGKRTALLATVMFASSAWVLHVSRLASFDVTYLWAMTTAILGFVLLSEYENSRLVWYFNLFILGIITTIPGLLWLVLLILFFEKDFLREGYGHRNKLYERVLSVLVLIIWLPLVILRLSSSRDIKYWLGLPAHFPSMLHLLKQFVAVPVHLLFRGPELPNVWLGKLPVLDAFALAMALFGGYYYIRHRRSSRSRLLASLILLSVILIGLNGSVGFSLIVPVAYLSTAMGLAYLMHTWKRVFPLNPVAKWVSLSILLIAVTLSCAYNLRSYFVAWPHNPTTYSTFDRYI